MNQEDRNTLRGIQVASVMIFEKVLTNLGYDYDGIDFKISLDGLPLKNGQERKKALNDVNCIIISGAPDPWRPEFEEGLIEAFQDTVHGFDQEAGSTSCVISKGGTLSLVFQQNILPKDQPKDSGS